jgi:hypothetical protein
LPLTIFFFFFFDSLSDRKQQLDRLYNRTQEQTDEMAVLVMENRRLLQTLKKNKKLAPPSRARSGMEVKKRKKVLPMSTLPPQQNFQQYSCAFFSPPSRSSPLTFFSVFPFDSRTLGRCP